MRRYKADSVLKKYISVLWKKVSLPGSGKFCKKIKVNYNVELHRQKNPNPPHSGAFMTQTAEGLFVPKPQQYWLNLTPSPTP